MDKNYFSCAVCNHAFGGTFTAKLSHEIREKRGWSYGCYSYIRPRRKNGVFYIWVFPSINDTIETIDTINHLYEYYINEGVTIDEFTRAKKNLIDSWNFEIDTAEKRVAKVMQESLLSFPKHLFYNYIDIINSINYENTFHAIKQNHYIKPLSIVVVCSANNFADKFEKFGEVTVIPYDQDFIKTK